MWEIQGVAIREVYLEKVTFYICKKGIPDVRVLWQEELTGFRE